MHYLHIFNECTVTDLNYKGKEITYHTKDYKIEIKLVKPAPNELYKLTVTTKQPIVRGVLDNLPTPAGVKIFICPECLITAENDRVLCMCGLEGNYQRYKIVIQKAFSF